MASSDEHVTSDGSGFNRLSPKYKIMEVNFVTGSASEIPLRPSTARSTPAPAAVTDGSSASFDTSHSIEASLNQAQPSRTDKIARANALLSDPSYPSAPVLNQLAGFLAKRL
jgi:hypothetical protein